MTMARRRGRDSLAQAWIELRSDDPSAVSALSVARARLPAGRNLSGLRRLRLVELRGPLPAKQELEELLHRSTQFYNPHKESCVVRVARDDAPPLHAGERAVLVFDRDGDRRSAAERWWLRETGERVEVREGIAWVLAFAGRAADVEDLALVRGRRHGLLCNPHSQECRVAGAVVPLPWLVGGVARAVPKPRTRRTAARSKR
jgi:hypothetical protein